MDIGKLTYSLSLDTGNFERQLKGFDRTASRMGEDAGENMGDRFSRGFRDELDSQKSSISNALDNVFTGMLQGAGIAAFNTAINAATGAITSLGGALASQVSKAQDFNQSLRRFSALSGANQEQVKALKEETLSLASQTSKTSQEIANASTQLARLGFSAENTEKVLSGVVNLSEATQESMKKSGEAVGTAINAFSSLDNTQADATKVADTYTNALNNTALTLNDVQQGLSSAGSVAANTGQTLGETVAVLGSLRSAGFTAETAGTALKTTLSRLANPAHAAAKNLKAIGVNVRDSSGDMRGFTDIIADMRQQMEGMSKAEQSEFIYDSFGMEAAPAVLNFLNKSQSEIDNLVSKMENSGGAAEDSAKKMVSAYQRLGSIVDTIGIRIGSALEKPLREVVQVTESVIKKVQEIGVNFQPLNTLSAELGSNLSENENLINNIAQAVVGSLNAAIKVTASISRGLINIFKSTFDWLNKNSESVQQINSFIQTGYQLWGQVFDTVGTVVSMLVKGTARITGFTNETDEARGAWSIIFDLLTDIVGVIDSILQATMSVNRSVQSGMVSAFNAVGSAVESLNNGIANGVGSSIDAVNGKVNNETHPAFQAVDQVVNTVTDSIGAGMVGSVDDVSSTVGGSLKQAWQENNDKIIKISNDISQGVVSSVGELAESINSVLAEAWQSTNDKIIKISNDISQGVVSSVGELAGSINNGLMNAWNATNEKIFKISNDIKNGVVNSVGELRDSITGQVVPAWGTAISEVWKMSNDIKNGVVDSVTSLADTIKTVLVGAWDAVIGKVDELVGRIEGALKSAANSAGEFLQQLNPFGSAGSGGGNPNFAKGAGKKPTGYADPYWYDSSPGGSYDATLTSNGSVKNVGVPSPTEGRVTKSGKGGGYGNYVEVQNENGTRWFMAHMKSVAVEVGEKIKKGANIGVQGSTGNSTGEHLHVEMRNAADNIIRDRSYTDPRVRNYFNNASKYGQGGGNPDAIREAGQGGGNPGYTRATPDPRTGSNFDRAVRLSGREEYEPYEASPIDETKQKIQEANQTDLQRKTSQARQPVEEVQGEIDRLDSLINDLKAARSTKLSSNDDKGFQGTDFTKEIQNLEAYKAEQEELLKQKKKLANTKISSEFSKAQGDLTKQVQSFGKELGSVNAQFQEMTGQEQHQKALAGVREEYDSLRTSVKEQIAQQRQLLDIQPDNQRAQANLKTLKAQLVEINKQEAQSLKAVNNEREKALSQQQAEINNSTKQVSGEMDKLRDQYSDTTPQDEHRKSLEKVGNSYQMIRQEIRDNIDQQEKLLDQNPESQEAATTLEKLHTQLSNTYTEEAKSKDYLIQKRQEDLKVQRKEREEAARLIAQEQQKEKLNNLEEGYTNQYQHSIEGVRAQQDMNTEIMKQQVENVPDYDPYAQSRAQARLAKRQEQISVQRKKSEIRSNSSYSPEQKEQMIAQLERLSEIRMNQLSEGVRTVGDDLRSAFSDGLVQQLKGLIKGTKSLGDAFKGLVDKITNTALDMGLNMLVGGMMSSLFGGGGGGAVGGGMMSPIGSMFGGSSMSTMGGGLGFGGTSPLAGSSGFSGNTTSLGFAEGGMVPNVESGVSNSKGDTVPAMLTPGEYVLNKQDTSKLKATGHLKASELPGFAGGGMVGSSKSDGDQFNFNIPINVSDNGQKRDESNLSGLKKSIQSVVKQQIIREQQAGGLLA